MICLAGGDWFLCVHDLDRSSAYTVAWEICAVLSSSTMFGSDVFNAYFGHSGWIEAPSPRPRGLWEDMEPTHARILVGVWQIEL